MNPTQLNRPKRPNRYTLIFTALVVAVALYAGCRPPGANQNSNNGNYTTTSSSPSPSANPSLSPARTLDGDSIIIIKGGNSIEVSLNSGLFKCPPTTEPPPSTPMRCVCDSCTLTGDVSVINGGSPSSCASGGGSNNVTVNGGDGGNGARDVMVQQTGPHSVTVLMFPSQYKLMPGSPAGLTNFHSNDAKMQGVTNGTTTCTGITQTTELQVSYTHPPAPASPSPSRSTTP